MNTYLQRCYATIGATGAETSLLLMYLSNTILPPAVLSTNHKGCETNSNFTGRFCIQLQILKYFDPAPTPAPTSESFYFGSDSIDLAQ